MLQPDFLPETIELVGKDLALPDAPPEKQSNTSEAFRNWLAGVIAWKIENDLEAFLQALYRLDIPEKKAMLALSNQTELPPPLALADLIIEREMQKIKTRRWYKEQQQRSTPPPEGEELSADTWD
ncbi:hypothetical protein C7N43_23590 [Sphingobacteriales bacterium UPWRP_1]|nr:hypothetical protein BVG80_09935 [Sphingobacteriales bacterium TSM_CSM]PSJ74516.1 hypothetical protein C7N43_23590 [Sphingobacteriales bacterium UPWRP_1]